MLSGFPLRDLEDPGRCLRDMVALSTLPAVWLGADPQRVAESLAAALFTTIRSDFVWVCLTENATSPPVWIAQTDRMSTDPAVAKSLGPAIIDWARSHDPDELLTVPNPAGPGTVRIACRPLGFDAELGAIAVGFVRQAAPDALQQTLFSLGATQATAAVQNAHLVRALREGERRISTLVSNLPGMAYRRRNDLNWTMEFVSDGVTAITGFAPEEFTSGASHWAQIVHPEDVEWTQEAVQSAAREHRAFRLEYRIRHKDGLERWVAEHGQGVFDSAPEAVAFEGFITDITERKRAEQAVRASEERFRALTSATSDVVYRMSPDWTEMRHLHGREFIADTLEPSRTWLDKYIHPEDQSIVMAAIKEAIRTQGIFELEHRVIRADGTPGWTHSRAVPILNERGEIVEWFGAASDVTKRKLAEDGLKQADRAKDEFLATLAHELRNPLAPLRNALQLLRLAQGASAANAPIREMMERQVTHLVRLVDDLLEVSRITRGVLELRRIRIEAAEIMRNALETSNPLIEAAGHQLSVSLPEEPLWVEGDPVRLAQILANLLNNAAKYTEPGGRISLQARREGSHVVMAVRDSGSGFARDALPRMFEMFTRGDRSSARSQGGLGIGLALSRRLAEMHGGGIEARSEGPGKGSEFSVRLPLAVNQNCETQAGSDPQTAIPQKRILVVDDNRDAAESLGMLLRFLGADVRIAQDGQQALATVQSYDPSVVLLDIGMPGMDGYEVARQIHVRFAARRPALIALTGWGQESDRRRAREAGFDHHLVKPTDVGTLQALLASIEGSPREQRSAEAGAWS